MRHSIATMALAGSLQEKMRAAAEAGFDAIELFENDLIQCSLSATQIRDMAAELRLKLDIYQPLRDFEGVSPAQLVRNLDRAERKFDTLQALGIELMLVCSNAQPDALGDRQLIADQLAELAHRAARRHLRIGFESLSWGTHCNRWSHAWDAVNRVGEDNLGLILDSYHTLALRDDFTGISEIPGERIFYLQLSDAPFEATSPPLYTRPLRTFPGLGQFDMIGFVATVLSTGYQGPLSLEIFSDEFRGAPAQATARAARASLIWLEEQLSRQPGPTQQQPLAIPPAVSSSARCSYLQLNTDAASRQTLDAQLSALGLTTAEAQLTVELRASMTPGVSVHELGISVSDPEAAQHRAEAFGYRAGDGEQAGTIAPDGSCLRFTPLRNAPQQEAQGTRLVSIIRAVPTGMLDSWATFYHLTTGLKPTAPLLKHDPHGVVRGRLLQGRELAIELETSTHQRTLAAGASVDQPITRLVFEVPDLIACLGNLRVQGIGTLAIAANYYDDLTARYALQPERLDELRQLNVLYDAQPQGEYLHACLPPFANGLCFELIERRGSYIGTDMANAYVLHAALSNCLPFASTSTVDTQGQ